MKARSRVHPTLRAMGLAGVVLCAFVGPGSAAPPDPAENPAPFSFVVWGHARGEGNGEPQLHLQETLDRMARLAPDFVVTTGDMIWGAIYDAPEDVGALVRQDYERLDAALERLGVPIYRIPGNHEVHNFTTRDAFRERYQEPPYAFTYRGSRFVLLDSIGIRQRDGDDRPYWGASALPLDPGQIEFLEKELDESARYDHVFLFLHHAAPWVEPDGFWWTQVHPLLRGKPVRVVFSGSPWSFKYAHQERDDVHYVLSVVEATKPFGKLVWETRLKHLASNRQPDTFQYVQVTGADYRVETVVVGEWATEGLSPHFWHEVESEQHRRTPSVVRAFQQLRTRRRIAAFLGVYGLCGAVAGFGIGRWARRTWARGR